MEEENDIKPSQQQPLNPMIENHGESIPLVQRSVTQHKRWIVIWGRVFFCLIMFVVVGTTLDAFVAYINGYADGIIHDADIDFTNGETSSGEIEFTFTLDATSWFQSHLHTLHVDGMECDLSMKLPKLDHHHRTIKKDNNNNNSNNEILEYYEETHVAHLSLLQSLVLRPRPLWSDITHNINSAHVKTNDEPDDAEVIRGTTTSHFLRGSESTNTESSSMPSISSQQNVVDNHQITTKVGISHVQFSSFATLLSTLTHTTPKIHTDGSGSNPVGMAQCVLNGRVDMYSMGHWGVSLQGYPVYHQHTVNLTHYINNDADLSNNAVPTAGTPPISITSSSSGGSGSGGGIALSKAKGSQSSSSSSSSFERMVHTLIHTLLSSTNALPTSALPTSTLPSSALPSSDLSINTLTSNAPSNSNPLSTHDRPINALDSNSKPSTFQPSMQPTYRQETTIFPCVLSQHMNPSLQSNPPLHMRNPLLYKNLPITTFPPSPALPSPHPPCNRGAQLRGRLGNLGHIQRRQW